MMAMILKRDDASTALFDNSSSSGGSSSGQEMRNKMSRKSIKKKKAKVALAEASDDSNTEDAGYGSDANCLSMKEQLPEKTKKTKNTK